MEREGVLRDGRAGGGLIEFVQLEKVPRWGYTRNKSVNESLCRGFGEFRGRVNRETKVAGHSAGHHPRRIGADG
jgi:hypothetical protein